jgi:hypothetical protein
MAQWRKFDSIDDIAVDEWDLIGKVVACVHDNAI